MALYDVWESKREIFIVTEYAGGGDLFTHFSDLSPNDMDEFTIAGYTHQILAALAHCHSLGVTFNGIQAENILLDKNKERVKLALSDSTR
ncbi:kinase-like protein [Clavulina sp. PMI_390]|nr:kinase-like protein [Clavulina sp. PMI_390]